MNVNTCLPIWQDRLVVHPFSCPALSEPAEINNQSKNAENLTLGWSTSNNIKVLLDKKALPLKPFLKLPKEMQMTIFSEISNFQYIWSQKNPSRRNYILGKLWIMIILKESSYSHFTFLIYLWALNCTWLFMHRNEENSWKLMVLFQTYQWPKSVVQYPILNRFYLLWADFKGLLILHHLHSDFLFISFSTLA